MPQLLYAQHKDPHYSVNRKFSGSQSWPAHCVAEEILHHESKSLSGSGCSVTSKESIVGVLLCSV